VSEAPDTPTEIRAIDAINLLLPATESACQVFALLKLFIDQASCKLPTFQKLVDAVDVPQVMQLLIRITENSRDSLAAVALLCDIFRKSSNEFPASDKLPLVKIQVETKTVPQPKLVQ
jgi:hypothetical protein